MKMVGNTCEFMFVAVCRNERFFVRIFTHVLRATFAVRREEVILDALWGLLWEDKYKQI